MQDNTEDIIRGKETNTNVGTGQHTHRTKTEKMQSSTQLEIS